MTTTIDEDSVISDATKIDDTDSPYTTSGEDTIQVDTSSGAVTVTLASADVTSGREIKVVDTGLNAGTNNITINTEGSETINPGANSSISIAIDGGYESFWTDGSNWFSGKNRGLTTLQTDEAIINNALTATDLTLSSDGTSPTRYISHSNTSGEGIYESVGLSVAADNTNNVIYEAEGSGHGNFLIVHGFRQGSTSDGFLDLITFAFGNSFTEFADEVNNQPSKVYSFSGGTLELAIDDAGETYDITVIALGAVQ
jgi:hypothetical protein